MRVLLTLTLLLTTLHGHGLNLRLSNNVVSDADKNAILKANDDDAFDRYLQAYPDVDDAEIKLSASPAAKKKVRAAEKKAFLKNLKKIKKHNKKFKRGETTYEMTVNSFAAMDDDNKGKFLGLNTNHSSHENEVEEHTVSAGRVSALPSSFDWKSRGWMTGVKNQGNCGSCWSFPTVALLEFAYLAASGNKAELSEQEMLDCTYQDRDGCNGGFYTTAWDWVVKNDHIAKMSDYRYKEKSGYCSSGSYRSAISGVMKLQGYTKVGASENSVMQALQTMPLAIAMYVEDPFFSLSKNGVYDGCSGIGDQINHAVTLTAYTSKYWEIKNSWGADWANKGYGKFQRNRGSICNILGWAYYIRYEDLNSSDGKGTDEEAEEATEGEETCADVKADCPGWKSYCTNGDYVSWMKDNCPKTCGHCTEEEEEEEEEEEVCEDVKAGCPDWTSYCKRTGYESWMKEKCPKTCGYCGGGSKCNKSLTFCNGVCKHEHMCHAE